MRVALYAIIIGLSVTAALVLWGRFRSTRNPGYALLLVGIGLWPLAEWGFGFLLRYIIESVRPRAGSLGDFVTTLVLIPRLLQLCLIVAGLLMAFRASSVDQMVDSRDDSPIDEKVAESQQ